MSTQDDRSRRDVSPPRASEKLAGNGYEAPRQKKGEDGGVGRHPAAGRAGWLRSHLEGQSGTRGLTVLAVVGAALLLAIGGVWSWNVGRHPQGVPVIGPPPYPVKDRPADPGGMLIMSDDTVQSDVTGRGTVHLAPPPEQPDIRLLAGRLNARSEGDQGGHPSEGTAGVSVGKNKAPAAASAGQEKKEAFHVAAVSPVREAGRVGSHVGPGGQDHAAAGKGGGLVVGGGGSARPAASGFEPSKRREAAPASVASSAGATSRYEVQLAALQNEEQARREWDHLRAALPDLLGGREPVFRAVEVGDKHFVRLRVGGFADRAAARRLCVQLHAQARACSVAAN